MYIIYININNDSTLKRLATPGEGELCSVQDSPASLTGAELQNLQFLTEHLPFGPGVRRIERSICKWT